MRYIVEGGGIILQGIQHIRHDLCSIGFDHAACFKVAPLAYENHARQARLDDNVRA